MNPPEHDPRLDPTPDYGSLGPASDTGPGKPISPAANWRVLAAVAVGALLGVPFVATGTVRAAWDQIAGLLSLQGKPEPASPAILSEHELERLDHQSPQHQATLLLQRAINHYDGANDQIAARVDGWRGKLQLDTQLNSLVTTALNSNDLRVRAAAIEVDLAAMNVEKSAATLEQFAAQAESGPQQQRVWALWAIGLMGNRGVEPERASQVLTAQLRDPEPDVRHWAVEGIGYVASDSSAATLLQTMHDDPSPMVRERAACSLAQSGMLSQQQRMNAVPQLLNYTEDAALDAQTRTWAFHALRDITGQSLPNDTAAWKAWYESSAH